MKLKTILIINAISSGLAGVLSAGFAQELSNLFQVNTKTPFIEIGIFLIAFAIIVFFTAFKSPISTGLTKLIIAFDITWVLASIIAVIALYSSISIVGILLILTVSLWVGMMAYLQGTNLKIS